MTTIGRAIETILTIFFYTIRVLDVVAVSSEDYKVWLNGLQLVLDLGGANIKQVCSMCNDSVYTCLYFIYMHEYNNVNLGG